MNNTSSSTKLKNLCNTIMNMDSRVRFVGVLDNKNTRLIEGGMRKSILPLLPAHKNDLFYLRIVSHLEELKDFKKTLGDTSYVFIKMDKISFVIMSLNEEEEKEKKAVQKQLKAKQKKVSKDKKKLVIPKARKQKKVSFESVESIEFHFWTDTG